MPFESSADFIAQCATGFSCWRTHVFSNRSYLPDKFYKRAKAELAKHGSGIMLTPKSDTYRLSGDWDLLGDVRSDGAGGQNRTGYARLFRAALYQ